MPEFADHDNMVDLLKEASQRDRMVVEFQKKSDGSVHAMDITDHVRILEDEQNAE
jgi:hypothetical protein